MLFYCTPASFSANVSTFLLVTQNSYGHIVRPGIRDTAVLAFLAPTADNDYVPEVLK